jgi:diadenosine tetraphosphatase ApaH/serine/threonine PP2A family protein phosphatase
VECLDAIRALACPTVLGNHDESVASGGIDGDLNPMARQGVEYSARKLDTGRRAWLSERPFIIKCGAATVVHASLEDPMEWIYILDAISAEPCLERQETPICFHGHTHRPAIYCKEDMPVATKIGDVRFQIPREGRTLVNPGSVGQPRDGNPRAQFVIFDPAEMTVELVRVPYDVTGAANAILEAGLPQMLATRLLHGR